ncbi:unnamed protein product [Rotaria socialis]|uniref:Uncharacterized protein n=2 Tax=Rotaria socialis TaxID=392032 RepID=A0A817QIV7_9BILA|nr:unnamed protein product [Rotaria socialis]CAF3208414.1 unnamed protein product [Rotaria socialis]CAF3445935.1 unnamed protein product [Rotaria socialis]CAF3533438.1 unnamed protein product [Rotaria socialis]CAF4254999.1 unnamed protein product [Rotaria socialis]
MHAIFLLALFFLPTFCAQDHHIEYDKYQRMFMPNSMAANYLSHLPIGRYRNQLLDATIDDSSMLMSSDQNDPALQQRTKRIYWENLAFHATDFNQKVKIPKRSK